MDVNFKTGDEDTLINLRSNRLRNSKTYGLKPKMDKKYTTTKSSINTGLASSLAKKQPSSSLAYQIPVSRKS